MVQQPRALACIACRQPGQQSMLKQVAVCAWTSTTHGLASNSGRAVEAGAGQTRKSRQYADTLSVCSSWASISMPASYDGVLAGGWCMDAFQEGLLHDNQPGATNAPQGAGGSMDSPGAVNALLL